jgi:hypothetical protein
MNEQVAKAIQTLKAYCRETKCDECPVHSAIDQICWLQGRPVEWGFVVDDFLDNEDLDESKAAQTIIDYCKQTECKNCPMYLPTNIDGNMCFMVFRVPEDWFDIEISE